MQQTGAALVSGTDDPSGPMSATVNAADSLQGESGHISWSELTRHFARGVVLRASASADLISLAGLMVADDVEVVRSLLESGELARASDDDARGWVARDPVLRCVVVAPWVVVQELQ